MTRPKLLDIGTTVEGVICDEHDWGGKNPRILHPRRRIGGTVIGIFTAAPNVVKIKTQFDTEYCIRTDLR
jgi:hypothetical protein